MPIIKKIDHLGIAVKNLEEAARFYVEALGISVEHTETVASQNVRVAFLPVGDVNLELLEATSPESAIARHIEKRGEGIQHISFEVEGIDELLAQLASRGAVVGSPTPVPGAHGTRVGFLHPKATGGVLIELAEKAKEGHS
ncbi:MAG: methylmalonyl-CoA epimerase [Chloroflexota bacterium]